jgi:hypothetical protein
VSTTAAAPTPVLEPATSPDDAAAWRDGPAAGAVRPAAPPCPSCEPGLFLLGAEERPEVTSP